MLCTTFSFSSSAASTVAVIRLTERSSRPAAGSADRVRSRWRRLRAAFRIGPAASLGAGTSPSANHAVASVAVVARHAAASSETARLGPEHFVPTPSRWTC